MMLEHRLPELRLFIHLTMRCNLSCTYCYTGGRRREVMPEAVGRRAVDFFFDRTDHLQLQFFGGEPLLELGTLRDVHAHAVNQARQRGLRLSCVVVTNGTLLTAEVVGFCRDNGIDVSLSLDGGRESQDATRVFPDGRGSFAAVERHLDELLRARPFTHVISVVNPDNLSHLASSFRYLVERGFRSLAISPDYTHPGFPGAVAELERQLEQVAAVCLERWAAGEWLLVDLFDEGLSPQARGRCQLGRRDFSVDPLGSIYPCACFVDHERFRLGSVASGIDAEAERAFLTEMEALDRHIAREHSACPADSFCRKGCGCTNLVAAGRPSRVLPVTCEIGRAIDRVRTRVREARRAARRADVP